MELIHVRNQFFKFIAFLDVHDVVVVMSVQKKDAVFLKPFGVIGFWGYRI